MWRTCEVQLGNNDLLFAALVSTKSCIYLFTSLTADEWSCVWRAVDDGAKNKEERKTFPPVLIRHCVLQTDGCLMQNSSSAFCIIHSSWSNHWSWMLVMNPFFLMAAQNIFNCSQPVWTHIKAEWLGVWSGSLLFDMLATVTNFKQIDCQEIYQTII